MKDRMSHFNSRGRSTRYSDRLHDFSVLQGCLCQQLLAQGDSGILCM